IQTAGPGADPGAGATAAREEHPMTEKRIVTAAALALAATLTFALPAAARPAAPRAVQASPAGLVRQGLAWLAALWGGGRERAATARAESGGGPAPNTGSTAGTASTSLATRPAGGGTVPAGFISLSRVY